MNETIKKYSRVQSYDNSVLKNAVVDITQHTSYNVSYEKVEKGRSVNYIVYHITKKRMEDDNSYK